MQFTHLCSKMCQTLIGCLLVLVASLTLSSAQTEFSGTSYLEPYESLEVASVIAGLVEKIHVKEGDYVKANQPLLTLNSDVIRAQYEVALTRAKSKGRIMSATAERDLQAHRYGLILKLGNEVERLKEYAILQTKEGNLITAKEELEIQRLEAVRIHAELSERVLTSRIDGIVDDINIDEGEVVGASRNDPDSDNYLVKVLQTAVLKATAFMPAVAVRGLKVGDQLSVVSSDPNDPWETTGEVFSVAAGIDAATGTVRIRVIIDNQAGRYKYGTPVKVIVKRLDGNQ